MSLITCLKISFISLKLVWREKLLVQENEEKKIFYLTRKKYITFGIHAFYFSIKYMKKK